MTYTATLTAEHHQVIADIRDRLMAAGLSTERADRAAAEAAVREVYRTAGIAEPRIVIWMDSPLGGLLAAEMIRQLGGQLGDQLGDQLWGQLRDQLGDQLWGQLGDQLRGQLGGQLGDQLRGQLGDQLRGQLRDQLGVSLDPWFEAYWLGFYTAGRAIAGQPPEPCLDALTRACSLLGWWWPQRGAVVLTDRPTIIARDGQGRLHHPDGPALAWADGYALHAWHSVRVPASLVDGDGWDTATILREPNTEVRRCAIERMGWDQFIPAAGLTQVGDAVPDPGNPGHELALYDVPERIYGDAAVRVLLCTNGTQERDGSRRRFGLTVPADITDPLHAAAWGYDLTPEQYTTAVRRA